MSKIWQGAAPEDQFTLIPNSLSRSDSISMRAKVVYIYLKSHRSGWHITIRRVADDLGLGRNTVTYALQDLIEAGYVQRVQSRRDGGEFDGWDYMVLSEPVTVASNRGHGDEATCENTAASNQGHGDSPQLQIGADRSSKSELYKKTISKKTKTPLTPHDSYSELAGERASIEGGGISSSGGGADAPADPWAELDRNPLPTLGESTPTPTPSGSHAQTTEILDEFIEHRGEPLSPEWRQGLGGHIRSALDDGVDPEVLWVALMMFDDGTSRTPNRYPHLVADARVEWESGRNTSAALDVMRTGTAKRLSEHRANAERVREERAEGRGLARLLARRGLTAPGDVLRETPEAPQGAVDGPESDTPTVPPPDA